MAIRLLLEAAPPGGQSAVEILPQLDEFLRRRCSEVLVGSHLLRGAQPTVLLHLHPAAESVAIYPPSAERLIVTADTTACGPGYHQYLCEVLHEMAAATGLQWVGGDGGARSDPTRYFQVADRGRLEQCFHEDVRAACVQAQALAEEAGVRFSLGLPPEHVFLHEGLVGTPLGPRDRAWVDAVAAGVQGGEDAWAWWREERDGLYWLDRALAMLWVETRWRPALHEGEEESHRAALECLERAYDADASLVFPWFEWGELLGFLGEERPHADVVQRKAATAGQRAKIGYRRGDVIARGLPGGWSVRIPGRFAEATQSDETWVAWDEQRSVHVRTMAAAAGATPPSVEQLLAGFEPAAGLELLTFGDAQCGGRAAIAEVTDPAGQRLLGLSGRVASVGHLAIVTVQFREAAQREWALATWQSLAPPPMPAASDDPLLL